MLVERIDARVRNRPPRPVWPFETRGVVRQKLSSQELQLLNDYIEQDRIWKKAKAEGRRSRSSLARIALAEFLAKQEAEDTNRLVEAPAPPSV